MGVAQLMEIEDLERLRAIRRHVRLESGRPDGRCGKVVEAIQAELGWAYRWGHLRLLDGGICSMAATTRRAFRGPAAAMLTA